MHGHTSGLYFDNFALRFGFQSWLESNRISKQTKTNNVTRKQYLLRVSGVISWAALTHVTTFRVDTNLRAVSVVKSTFIDISTASLVVGCNIALITLTTIAEMNE